MNPVKVPADIVQRAKSLGHSPEKLARLWVLNERIRTNGVTEDPPRDFWAMYRDTPEDVLSLILRD